jgi:hypothetical protein
MPDKVEILGQVPVQVSQVAQVVHRESAVQELQDKLVVEGLQLPAYLQQLWESHLTLH